VLPAPYATKSSANSPSKVSPPEGFLPTVPAGFKINVFATGFKRPRWLIVAPNNDIFVADTGAETSMSCEIRKITVGRNPERSSLPD